MERSALNSGVRELLARQLIMVQQAVEFNMAIARRLELEDKEESECPPVRAMPVPTAVLQPAVRPGSGSLAEEALTGQCYLPLSSLTHLSEPYLPLSSLTHLSEPFLPRVTQQVLAAPEGRERYLSVAFSDGGNMGRQSMLHDVTPEGRERHVSSISWDGGTRPRKSMFPSAEELKGQVLQHLSKPEYHVEDLYKQTGMFQRIARSRLLQNAALAAIALNSLWIAYETDNNKADVLCNAAVQFQVVDSLFCVFFVFEITTRLLAFSSRRDALRDSWWLFDFSLVALMVWETWIQVFVYKMSSGAGIYNHLTFLMVFRLPRLTRVFRMVRLVRQVPELAILIKAIAIGTRAVSAMLTLLLAIIYAFAILFTQLLSGTAAGAGCFETVPQAMICLLHQGVFTDQADFLSRLLGVDWSYYALMVMYLLLATVTVLNLLIGLFCEIVHVVAQADREDILVKDLQQRVGDLIGAVDPPGSETVSKRRFAMLMSQAETTRILHEVGVDVVALVQFGDFIFHEQEDLPLSDFLAAVLQFRGTNQARVKDIVDLRKFVSREIVAMEQRMGRGA